MRQDLLLLYKLATVCNISTGSKTYLRHFVV